MVLQDANCLAFSFFCFMGKTVVISQLASSSLKLKSLVPFFIYSSLSGMEVFNNSVKLYISYI